jgi:hypothetical protein
VAAGRKPSRAYRGTGSGRTGSRRDPGKPDDRVRLPAPPSGREADRRLLLASAQPRHAAAAAVPLRHRETQRRRAAPRLARAIGASGQLPEDWPSSGHIHRRVARYAGGRSRESGPPRGQRQRQRDGTHPAVKSGTRAFVATLGPITPTRRSRGWGPTITAPITYGTERDEGSCMLYPAEG